MDLHIIIYPKCNLKCSYCFYNVNSLSYKKNKLDLASIQTWIDKSNGQIENVTFTGGEPTLHRNFLEIVSQISDQVESIKIISNGTMLTREMAESLKQYKAKIDISLDSITSNLHEEIRGGFKKTINGINIAKEIGILSGINTVLTTSNLDQVDDLIAFARLKETKINFSPVDIEESNSLNLLSLSLQEKNSLLRKLENYYCDDRNHYFKLFYLYLHNNKLPNFTKCYFSLRNIILDSDGNFYPCYPRKDIQNSCLGSIFNNSFEDVMLKLQEMKLGSCFKLECFGLYQ
ncbi:radical SAM protein [Listeria innocua]|uniref:radical SAM protein n=1 Tax=Listeria innocua TaxID=1642 RepID=UPI0016282CF0|nr:radical SAM protein [Listeria innocua]MBC1925432.1 radical SAM protein [Listeria innocua]